MTGRAKRVSRKDMSPEQLREHIANISKRYRQRTKQGIRINIGDGNPPSLTPERQHEYWVTWISNPVNRDKRRKRQREYARRKREDAKKNKEPKDDAC